MSNVTQTATQNVTATLGGAQNVKITHVSIGTISTEVSHSLQANLKQLRFRHQGSGKLQYAFVATESSTNYFSVHKGCLEHIENISFGSKVLYIQSDKVGTVEIMELY